jgi:hypothetical protein
VSNIWSIHLHGGEGLDNCEWTKVYSAQGDACRIEFTRAATNMGGWIADGARLIDAHGNIVAEVWHSEKRKPKWLPTTQSH